MRCRGNTVRNRRKEERERLAQHPHLAPFPENGAPLGCHVKCKRCPAGMSREMQATMDRPTPLETLTTVPKTALQQNEEAWRMAQSNQSEGIVWDDFTNEDVIFPPCIFCATEQPAQMGCSAFDGSFAVVVSLTCAPS